LAPEIWKNVQNSVYSSPVNINDSMVKEHSLL